MDENTKHRRQLWRQCAFILGLSGLTLLWYSSAVWLAPLINVITCFLMPSVTGTCQAVANGEVVDDVTPMALYMSVVISCVGARIASDMASLWRMPKRDPEPPALAALPPYKVLAHVLVYHASYISLFALVGNLLPQFPYWLTQLFGTPESVFLGGVSAPSEIISAGAVFLHVQAIVLLLVAIRVTRVIRNQLTEYPYTMLCVPADEVAIHCKRTRL